MSLPDDIKSIFEVPPRPPPKKPSFWRTQAKYFLHGFLWAVVNFVGYFVIVFLMVLLVLIGFILGLIIGLFIMFLTVGAVNWLLSERLWFRMKEMTFWGVLEHGLFLGILLLIVDALTVWLPAYIAQDNVIALLTLFIWACYINGYLGKRVAENWREPEPHKPYNCNPEIASPNLAPATNRL